MIYSKTKYNLVSSNVITIDQVPKNIIAFIGYKKNWITQKRKFVCFQAEGIKTHLFDILIQGKIKKAIPTRVGINTESKIIQIIF